MGAGAATYCDVFSIAFSLRRVSSELRASFTSLIAIMRCYRRAAAKLYVKQGIVVAKAFCMLRSRMTIVIDALEWYLQNLVIQPKYEQLVCALRESGEGEKHVRSAFEKAPSLYDRFQALQRSALDSLQEQCFLQNNTISTRLAQLFDSCDLLCDAVRMLASASNRFEDCLGQAKEAEQLFARNLNFLVQLLEQSKSTNFYRSTSELLLRLQEPRNLASTPLLPENKQLASVR